MKICINNDNIIQVTDRVDLIAKRDEIETKYKNCFHCGTVLYRSLISDSKYGIIQRRFETLDELIAFLSGLWDDSAFIE